MRQARQALALLAVVLLSERFVMDDAHEVGCTLTCMAGSAVPCTANGDCDLTVLPATTAQIDFLDDAMAVVETVAFLGGIYAGVGTSDGVASTRRDARYCRATLDGGSSGDLWSIAAQVSPRPVEPPQLNRVWVLP